MAVNVSEYTSPWTATGRGEVVVITRGAFTGSVKLPVAMFAEESVTVTGKETDVAPGGGVPERTPAALNISQDGNPEADQVYPPVPPEAVKVSV